MAKLLQKKGIKLISVLIFVFLIIQHVFSQKTEIGSYEELYNKGKQLYDEKKFSEAMIVLEKSIKLANGTQAPYSLFYYSLSAFKLEKYDISHTTLLKLRKNYPGWNKMSDVFYLLANISFIKGNLAQGISYLDGVYDGKLKTDKENMKIHYLKLFARKDVLNELLRAFPNDKIIGEILAKTLVESEYSEQNLKLMESLMQRFDSPVIKEYYRLLINNKTTYRDSYNIGIMLPFYLDKKEPNPIESRRSQMSLDMIQGIKMGVDSLTAQNIKINIYAYDTQADSGVVRELIRKPELKKMDFFIGPVFNAPSKKMAKFCKTNEICMVNPLSPNDELLKDNNYVFLVKPSITMQARKMAEYAYQNFVPRKVVILFSSSDIDKAFATAYKEEFERLAGEVAVFKEITSSNIDNVATIINSFPLSGVGHIYLPSAEERIVVNLLSILEVLRIRLPIVGISDWLNFETISFEQMEKNQFHFVNADVVDYSKPECRNFRNKFKEKYKSIPTLYAYQGYDLITFFSKIIKEYGPNFHDKIHSLPPYKGIQIQFDYRQNNDNQSIIIYSFRENQLVPVNVKE